MTTNSTPEITIDITSPEGATESDVLVTAVLNAMKPAIERIVAEAVRQAANIERSAIAEQLEARAAEVREEEFFGAREGAEVLRAEAAIVRARR